MRSQMTTSAYSNPPSEMLTVREIARLCKVHEVTVRRHIREGRLKAVKMGKSVRVRREDFEAYLRPEPWAGVDLRPLPPDDPLFGLIGIAHSGSGGLAENKYAAFAEAFSPRP